MIAHGPRANAEQEALRAALTKIEVAESLVARILACEAPSPQAERLEQIRSEIRSISMLIRQRLSR